MSNSPTEINVSKLRQEIVLRGNSMNSWISLNKNHKGRVNAQNTAGITSTEIERKTSNRSRLEKLNKATNKTYSVKGRVITYIEEYLRFSTLHGLRYVGNSLLSFWERAFWLVSFLIALVFAVYFINNIYLKYDKDPVITIMNPRPYSMEHIPFPAVTICNMQPVKRIEAEAILANGTTADKGFLEDLCNLNSATQAPQKHSQNWTYALKFLSRVSQPCKRMLKQCQWRHEDIDCELIFKTVLTDNGLCCTFNQLPVNYIFRQPERNLKYKITHSGYHIDDWNPERGYSKSTSLDKTYPFRSIGAGSHLGLTVVLNVDEEDYYCSTTNSEGFNLLLHNPLEIPRMDARAFMVLPGYEERIVFTPRVHDATTTLKSMRVSKRKCYFTNERYLKYYRIYSRVNCKMECLINYTLERCECVATVLPTSPSARVCGRHESCRFNAEAWLDEHEEHEDEDKETKCNCLPACFQIDYEVSMTYAKIWNQTFINNSAIAHIFFTDLNTQRFTKKELYEFSEFLSLTGGLLGLFLGISALSIVELCYYLSLKLFCNARHKIKINRP